jgi:hypothetical protein
LDNVVSFQLHFPTQKQTLIHNIVAVQPIIIDRQCPRSSALVDKLVQWSLENSNHEQEEYLTRFINGKSKKLLRRNVAEAIKESARLCGIDPARVSTHSIRRNYADISFECNATICHHQFYVIIIPTRIQGR